MPTISNPIVIHILESPKAEEMLGGIHEGSALRKVLEVAGIEARLHTVVNTAMLRRCIERITNDFKSDKTGSYLPVLHFSAHGNNDAVGLTDGTSLKWEDFGSILAPLNAAMGGCLLLFMSTCQGYSGFKMAHTPNDPPFGFLVGPTEKVSWSQSLLAFHTLYHHFFHRDLEIDHALKAVNAALAFDPPIFRVAHGDEVNESFKRLLYERVRQLFGISNAGPSPSASS